MRLSVIAVGRLKAGPEKVLADDYLTRAEAFGRRAGVSRIAVSEFAESQGATAALRVAEERRMIAAALPPRGFTVVLDERGKALGSEAFAEILRRHLDDGTPEVSFVIGGPDGHAAETKSEGGLLLSLGAMTWPHRLVRVMLFEQIYRALTILLSHPYHRP